MAKQRLLVISPLVSIIKDQIPDTKSIGYSAVDISELTVSEIRQRNFKSMRVLRNSRRPLGKS